MLRPCIINHKVTLNVHPIDLSESYYYSFAILLRKVLRSTSGRHQYSNNLSFEYLISRPPKQPHLETNRTSIPAWKPRTDIDPTTDLVKMFPSDYLGHKRCLDALDEILSAYNKMATDSEKQITVDIIDYRINFIASLSTDVISFEDQVKIVTQLIDSRTTMKKHLIESSAIDSAINKKLRTLRRISEEELDMLVGSTLSGTIKPFGSEANLVSVN